jgi:hypothetical protein
VLALVAEALSNRASPPACLSPNAPSTPTPEQIFLNLGRGTDPGSRRRNF